MHANAPASGHEDIAIVQGVGQLRQTAVSRWRGRVRFGRRLHGQGLVWPLFVEFVHEGVEATLLLQAVHACRAGGFLFQGQVHALVPAVLLRMSRANALDADAQA
jgi:hypothetical protein